MTVSELREMLLLVPNQDMQVYIPSTSPDGTVMFMESCAGMSNVIDFTEYNIAYHSLDGKPLDAERLATMPKEGFVIFSHDYHEEGEENVDPQQN